MITQTQINTCIEETTEGITTLIGVIDEELAWKDNDLRETLLNHIEAIQDSLAPLVQRKDV